MSTRLCEVCATNAATHILTVPTDANSAGLLYCDRCTMSTSADFERMHPETMTDAPRTWIIAQVDNTSTGAAHDIGTVQACSDVEARLAARDVVPLYQSFTVRPEDNPSRIEVGDYVEGAEHVGGRHVRGLVIRTSGAGFYVSDDVDGIARYLEDVERI